MEETQAPPYQGKAMNLEYAKTQVLELLSTHLPEKAGLNATRDLARLIIENFKNGIFFAESI